MISAIIIGRGGEQDLPNKNRIKLKVSEEVEYPMMAFPIEAALGSSQVDKVFFVTEDKILKDIAIDFGAEVLDELEELAQKEVLGETVFQWAYKEIVKAFGGQELVLTMFANAPCIQRYQINEMIGELKSNNFEDSICTVSAYPMFSPHRARKISNGILLPYIDDLDFNDITCDRKSSETPYYYDCSCAVVKPRCLEDLNYGYPPMRWLGKRILAYENFDPACDVDEEWQIDQVTRWLREWWVE